VGGFQAPENDARQRQLGATCGLCRRLCEAAGARPSEWRGRLRVLATGALNPSCVWVQGRVHCKVGKVRVRGTTITKDEEEGVAWLRSAAVGGDGRHRCAQTLARETKIQRRAHGTLWLPGERHAETRCACLRVLGTNS